MAEDVTVIIPVFNAEDSIERTLQSVLAQTVKPLEIIVVDDGSTDGTVRAAKRFGSNVRLIKLRGHSGGLSIPRNKGIKAARSTYVQVFSAGAEMRPKMLQKICHMAAMCPGMQVGFCDLDEPDFAATQCRFRQLLQPMRPDGQRFYLLSQPAMLDSLMYEFSPRSSALLVSKEAWSWVGGYDESLRRSEDIDFAFKLARRYAFGFVDQKLFGMQRKTEPDCAEKILAYEAAIAGMRRQTEAPVSALAQRMMRKRISEMEVELAWACSDAGSLPDALKHFWRGWRSAGWRKGMVRHSRKLLRHFVTLTCKRIVGSQAVLKND